MEACRCGACRSECMVVHLPDEVWIKLVSLMQRMVDESGEPVGFDARTWLRTWLHEDVPSLG